MTDYEFSMSLSIRHPHVKPADITRHLGIEPQHAWCVGDPRRDSAGSEVGDSHHDSYWRGSLLAQPDLSADRVGVESEMLRTLAPLRKSFGFLQTLTAEGGVNELHVSIIARDGLRLEFLPASLSLLGRLGFNVALHVVPQHASVEAIAP